eukprot:455049-Hanusia_phi.AAC.1
MAALVEAGRMLDPLALASQGREAEGAQLRASIGMPVFHSIPASISSRISNGPGSQSHLLDPLVPEVAPMDAFNCSSRVSQPSLTEQLPENIGSLIHEERRSEIVREQMQASRRWSNTVADRASILKEPPVVYVPEVQQVQTLPSSTTYTSSAPAMSNPREPIVFPIPQSLLKQGRPPPRLAETANEEDKARSFFEKYSWVRLEEGMMLEYETFLLTDPVLDLKNSQESSSSKYMSKLESERIESNIPDKLWKVEGVSERRVGRMPRDEVFMFLKECEDDYKEKQSRAKYVDDGGLSEYNLRVSEARLLEARSLAREELTKISKESRSKSQTSCPVHSLDERTSTNYRTTDNFESQAAYQQDNNLFSRPNGRQCIFSIHVREAVGLSVLLQNQASTCRLGDDRENDDQVCSRSPLSLGLRRHVLEECKSALPEKERHHQVAANNPMVKADDVTDFLAAFRMTSGMRQLRTSCRDLTCGASKKWLSCFFDLIASSS